MSLWAVVIGLWFFAGVFWNYLWILSLVVWAAFAGLAIAVTALSIAALLRQRRWRSALAALAVPAGVSLIVFVVGWTQVYPRVWFWTHQSQFVAAERSVRSGNLPTPDSSEVRLPASIAAISVDGKLSTTHAWDDEAGFADPCGSTTPILFAPAWIGIPDGATGFVHIPCQVATTLELDGFADPMCPSYALASGWWWADGISCDLGD